MPTSRITMSHGAGGKAMQDLIRDVFVSAFDSAPLSLMEDQASLALETFTARGDRLSVTTDSYVVDPLFFPGGDIGSLAVNGTVNDLAVGGAMPLYLTCGLILEEGCEIDLLKQVIQSMAHAARRAHVQIIAGDTKVVQRGAADKLFINTTGIGVIPGGLSLSAEHLCEGDAVLINGTLGDHGIAIVDARGDLALGMSVQSDCQPLTGLVSKLLDAGVGIRCMRDATRGGVATVLNELAARASGMGIRIDEKKLPIRQDVQAACELLGLDPLYLANEGKLILIVADADVDRALNLMRSLESGRDATQIGTVVRDDRRRVSMRTLVGGERLVDVLVGEQLPRIC